MHAPSSLRHLTLSLSILSLSLAACSSASDTADEAHESSADELNTASDPRAWNDVEAFRPAAGAYLLRGVRDVGALAKCPRYTVLTVEADKRRVLFEERPLYYDLDASFVEGLRSLRYSGFRTESFEPARNFGTTIQGGALTGPTSPYAGAGTMTVAITKAVDTQKLKLRFSVDSPDNDARYPKLVCEYERMADTVKQMAPGVIQGVQDAWTTTKRTVSAASDTQIDALCKAITTNRYWSAGEWSRGLCDGADAATNRTKMVGALDAALKSLAKEKLGLTDPAAAYGGRTDGLERLYLAESRRAVFGGFAPTELLAEEVESTTRKEACADSALEEKDCKLHGAIRAAFMTQVHDAP